MSAFVITYGREEAKIINFGAERFPDRSAAMTWALEHVAAAHLGREFAETVAAPGDLVQFSSGALVALYNAALPEGGTPVKRFATSEAGRKRLFQSIVSRFPAETPASSPEAIAPTAEGQEDNSTSEQVETQEDDMAKAKKAAKKNGKGKKTGEGAGGRVVAASHITLGTGAPPQGTTCGLYIRSLVMQGKLTTNEMLAKVKKHYPDSTCKGSDISWNRARLRDHYGIKSIPDVVREEKAAAK